MSELAAIFGAGGLWQIFTPTTGVWTLVAIAAVTLFRTWPLIMARLNEQHRDTEAAKAGDWARLREEIARLDRRCDDLQREVDECRARETEWMRRAVAAEAVSEGIGEVRQRAQTIVSAERLTDDAHKKIPKPGEGR